MDKYRNDIEKYIRGELTPAQMHALERKALHDPFLAEALEGAAHSNPNDFSKDITELNEKIVRRKPATWTWPMRIAASVLLLAVSTFIVWIALKQDPELGSVANKPDSAPENLSAKAETEPAQPDSQPKESISTPRITESKKETPPPAQRKQRSKKSSPEQPIETRKTEQPLANENINTPLGSKPLEANQQITTIDPAKQNELQSPTATDIKIAEGYIAAIDARPTIVAGYVLSAEDGTPLPDVSVALKGTSVVTKTDAFGRYSIIANSQQKTLIYSSQGLESTEVKIDGIDSTYLPVKIEMTDEALAEEAVETGGMRDYGPTNVYTIPAHPETGNRLFKQYLIKNHKYPKEAKETNIEGTVIIEFKVDATGALSEFKIVRSIGNGCDEEVIRLILQGAKWVPTTKDGTPVNDKARVKFKFELEE